MELDHRRSLDLNGNNLPIRILSPGGDWMWSDSDLVTTGVDDRFQADKLNRGIKCRGDFVKTKGPSKLAGEAGNALSGIEIQKPGEIRDLGDIMLKVLRQ